MRRVIGLVFILGILCMPTLVLGEEIEEGAAAESRSHVLMEASSGQVLKDHNMNDSIPPASITKVMTLLLIHDAVAEGKITWDEQVTVSEHAASMGGSQVFMEVGEQQTVRELVKCIAIASANDAAVAMSEHIGGSEQQFVDMMNEKAQELGMENTTFKNACGLHVEGHVSSAYDVALMSRELITKYPDITKTVTIWMDTIVHRTKRGESEFGLTNTNKMLKWYPGITGLKTGYTPEAKHCVSATAKRDDMELIAVVLGGADSKARFREAGLLLDHGFANYAVKAGPQAGEVLAQVPVVKGVEDTVDATIEESMRFVISKTAKDDNYEYSIEMVEELKAPITKGQKVGELSCLVEDEIVGSAPLVAMNDVEKAGLKNVIPSTLKKFFGGKDKDKDKETQECVEEEK
ncbi:MAG: D-alanyl-D-alanine carboxypeptidase [Epulopiscium sp. Nele67-Bin002]|nr:MAG: D-alanyl-D-alanine carboxypeptidase [Epulopiscium sp. Nuni2H_MBin001]OON90252.1 MAG: D-alanyl-D-alanine carboxypeptidase [Epulopiscium sp. Nele67-Bin001]OON92323.1 MAG: D-alanyl-D-alanine carboxypeptidase [Epulopiscium sp. Nele67-Bin002]